MAKKTVKIFVVVKLHALPVSDPPVRHQPFSKQGSEVQKLLILRETAYVDCGTSEQVLKANESLKTQKQLGSKCTSPLGVPSHETVFTYPI
jgi:hypothetical protein